MSKTVDKVWVFKSLNQGTSYVIRSSTKREAMQKLENFFNARSMPEDCDEEPPWVVQDHDDDPFLGGIDMVRLLRAGSTINQNFTVAVTSDNFNIIAV